MTVAIDPTTSIDTESQQLLLDVRNTVLTVTSEQFDLLCADNPDLRLELTPNRELTVMPPAGGESSKRNLDLAIEVGIWNRQTNLGEAFDSSGGYDFTALGGGKPAPDVSWIEKSRLEGVNIVGFIPVVPDFVIELRSLEKVLHLGKPQDRTFRSATDNLKPLQDKMREYQRLGVRLGLLVNPKNQQVEIYRPGQEPEALTAPTEIDCNDVMPGFSLSLSRIW